MERGGEAWASFWAGQLLGKRRYWAKRFHQLSPDPLPLTAEERTWLAAVSPFALKYFYEGELEAYLLFTQPQQVAALLEEVRATLAGLPPSAEGLQQAVSRARLLRVHSERLAKNTVTYHRLMEEESALYALRERLRLFLLARPAVMDLLEAEQAKEPEAELLGVF